MKKLLVMVLALTLAISCAIPAYATTFISIATGGTGGTYYPLGGDIANLFMKNIPDLDVVAQATGGSAENLRLIDKGEAELATVQSDTAAYAAQGIDSFDGEQITSAAAIASLYPEVVQLVASAEAGITCIADLKGKRVSIGAAGSGVYTNAMHMLEVAGLTVDDIDAQYLSFAESTDAIKNRQIDAAFITAGVPNPSVTELASTYDVVMVPLSDDEIATLCASKPYVEFSIPAETYTGMAEPVKAVAITAILVCSKDLDEELVYQMTKTLFEKTDEMTHAKKSEIKLETATYGIAIELHPGAARYYAEVLGTDAAPAAADDEVEAAPAA